MENLKLQTSSMAEQHQKQRLSCRGCKRKKIKCDRRSPCGQCQSSGLPCAPSTRKLRAQNSGKRAVDSELRSRISKLESLVESLSGEVTGQNGGSNGHSDSEQVVKNTDVDAASPGVRRYIGSPFWSSLTTEVQALREVLEEDQENEEAEARSPTTPSNGINGDASNTNYDFIMCPPGSIYVMPGALNEPSPEMAASLYGVFTLRVAPLFKAYHVPSLRALLERGSPYLGLEAESIPNRALKATFWYAAVSAMSDPQCIQSYGESRNDLAQRFRRCADVLLSQADLVITNDCSTLQALVTYVFALRRFEPGRRAWTLVALAVRIAHVMKLHQEASGRSPFETQIRRRLWHQIRFLDVYAALDRGTESLIAEGSYDTPWPSNVNDCDIDEASTSIMPHSACITDMTFPLMTYEATAVTQRLNTPELSPKGDTWQQRLELAESFARRIYDTHLQYVNPAITWHRLIRNVGNSMCTGMFLRAVRPPQRHLSSVPPRVDSPYVLQMAVDCLEQGAEMNTDPELEPWRFTIVWVQWHPLAVALAGLCSIRGTELAERAWRAVEGAYAYYSRDVADTRNGMLWRPIEKLYKKASTFRDEGLRLSRPATVKATETTSMPTMSSVEYRQFMPSIAHPSSTTAPLYPNGQVGLPELLPSVTPIKSLSTGSVTESNLNPATPDLQMVGHDGGDMSSWLDWEGIMDDFSPLDAEQMDLGDLQASGYLLQGSEWPGGLPQGPV